MYVVMLDKSKDKDKTIEIFNKLSKKLNKDLILMEDLFLPLNELKERINSMCDKSVLITFDDRVLEINGFCDNADNIFIFKDGEVCGIKELTIRILRVGHNIRKLYLSGEFN